MQWNIRAKSFDAKNASKSDNSILVQIYGSFVSSNNTFLIFKSNSNFYQSNYPNTKSKNKKISFNRHDSRFHTFSSRPAKHSLCCAWDFYECSIKHKNAGQSNDIKVKMFLINQNYWKDNKLCEV